MITVLLTHGYIGFGKTTVAKKFEEMLGYRRFTHDEYMVKMFGDHPSNEEFRSNYNTATKRILYEAREAVKNGDSIILDFGFWSRDSRFWIQDVIRKWEKDLNIDISILWLNIQCDIEIARKRCVNRDNNRKNGELWVPVTVFDGKLHKFEPMSDFPNEFKDSQIVVKN